MRSRCSADCSVRRYAQYRVSVPRWLPGWPGVAALAIAVAAFTGLTIRDRVEEQQKATHAEGLVHRLLDADIAQVPGIVSEIEPNRQWADRLLRNENDKAAANSREKLHASLALMPVDPGQVDYLYGRLLGAAPNEVPVIRDALAPHKRRLARQTVGRRGNTGEGQGIATAASGGGVGEVRPGEREVGDRSRGCRQRSGGSAPCYLCQWIEALRPVQELRSRSCRLSIEIPAPGNRAHPWQRHLWPTTPPTIRKCWPIC